VIERVNGIDLAFDEWGSGEPPMVLLHGFTASRLDWADVAVDLARDRRVLAYDQRGHGDSTHSGKPESYTLSLLVDDLEGFATVRDLVPFDLIGHSLGGVVAMRFAVSHSRLLRSLVLVDATAAPVEPVPAEVVCRLAEVGRQRGMAALADLLDRIGDRGVGTPDERQRKRAHRNVSCTDVEAFAALGVELGCYDSMHDRLAMLNLPITVIRGAYDTPVQADSEALAAAIPGCVVDVIPDAAHAPHEEKPAAWLAVARAHLARTEQWYRRDTQAHD
jgi:pimeloyl-ACP methyl ester carboxylesterase